MIWNMHAPGESSEDYNPAGPLTRPKKTSGKVERVYRLRGGPGGQSATRRAQKRAYRRHVHEGGERIGLKAFLAGG